MNKAVDVTALIDSQNIETEAVLARILVVLIEDSYEHLVLLPEQELCEEVFAHVQQRIDNHELSVQNGILVASLLDSGKWKELWEDCVRGCVSVKN